MGYEFTLKDEKNKLFKTDNQDISKEIKKFLNKQGNKVKRDTVNIAKKKIKKKTGKYQESIKKGKVYKSDSEGWSVRVYTNAPHSHLIEDGHDIVIGGKKGNGGKVVGKVKGKKILKSSSDDFCEKFFDGCENLVDELLNKGFFW